MTDNPYFAARDRADEREQLVFVRGDSRQRFTALDFWRAVEGEARRLLALGARPGGVVLIFAQNSAAALFAFFAAQRVGAIPSLMPPPSPRQPLDTYLATHKALVERIAPALILADAPHAERLGAAFGRPVAPLEAPDEPRVAEAGEALASTARLATRRKAQPEAGAGFSRATVDHERGDAPLEGIEQPRPAPEASAGPAGVGASSAAPKLAMPLPTPEATALLQHSSGTTGLKKGVMLDYRVLDHHLAALEDLAGVDEETTIVSWLPLYHDMGLIACTLLPVVRRRRLVLMDTFAWLADPLSILRLAAEAPRAVLWLPNFAFNHLANQARRQKTPLDLSRVAGIVNSSEPCKPASMARFLAAFAPHGLPAEALKCCYGMAENVYAVTQTPEGRPPRTLHLDRARHEAGRVTVLGAGTLGEEGETPAGALAFASCGRVAAGSEIAIRRPDGTPAAPDEIGRIFLRGASLFSGYYDQPGLTAERFVGGWFDTHDLGFLHEGELYVSGRVDDLIIVNGKNLLAHDIEGSVGEISGVKPGRCSAFGCEDERTGSESLVVAAEVPDAADGARVREEIHAAVFGEFGVTPADIVLTPVDTLLKTTSGKMSRSENRARYLAGTLVAWG